MRDIKLGVEVKFIVILLILGEVLFLPIQPIMPAPGLDSSWVFVLNQAIRDHWIFGKDIIFTYGFFSYLGTFAYDPVLFPYLMLLWFFFLITMIVYVENLLRGIQGHWIRGIASLLFLSSGVSCGPVIFFPVYVLVLGLYILRQGKLFNFWTLCGSGLLAVVTFIKFSYGLFAFLVIFECSFLDIKKKRIPINFFVYVGTFLLVMFLNHQPFSNFIDFINGVIQISSAYNGGMGLGGTRFFPIIVYLVVAFYLCRFFGEINYYSSKNLNRWALILLAFSFFVVFKTSFIRADHHIFNGFMYELSISIFLIFLYLSKYSGRLRDVFKEKKIICLALLVVIFSFVCKINIIPNPGNSIRSVVHYFHLARDYEASLENIRQQYPLPKIKGTADIYSYDQFALLANNMNYNPRPEFQSYPAGTSQLLRINRDHLLAKAAPDNIFFAVQPIDNRYPSIEDGLSWPVLLSHYTLKQHLTHYLWLVKRFKNSDVAIVPMTRGTYRIGDEISVPSSLNQTYVWAKITFPNNIANELISVLYKPVQTYLVVTLKSGRTQQYRYIEGMGTEGFLLSPLIETNDEFSNLYTQKGRNLLLKSKQIKSFKITYHGWQAFFIPTTYQVEFDTLALR